MNHCTKFHSNPSNRCRETSNVKLIVALQVNLQGHQGEWASSSGEHEHVHFCVNTSSRCGDNS